ncbi:hypothetical protein AZ021_001729 [Enterobacter ludwigii]|nr:hypothetical protein AZ021_001729 [Enterobacter ludwigii]
MGFSERLAQAMKHAGYTQGRLAKDVGMAQSSVKALISYLMTQTVRVKPLRSPLFWVCVRSAVYWPRGNVFRWRKRNDSAIPD